MKKKQSSRLQIKKATLTHLAQQQVSGGIGGTKINSCKASICPCISPATCPERC